MQQAMILTVLGMGTVFAVLTLIYFVIVLISKILQLKDTLHSSAAQAATQLQLQANVDEETEVAAAIAAVLSYLELQGHSTQKVSPACRYNIRVPIVQGAPATWLTSVRTENPVFNTNSLKQEPRLKSMLCLH